MKKSLLTCLFAASALGWSALNGQPTDNPVAGHYGPGGYPAWVDSLAWDNVIDVTADSSLSVNAVAGDPAAAADNFAAFEEARDLLYDQGGGVLYFPAGTYHFELPDMGYGPGIGPMSRGLMLKEGVVIRGADLPAGANQAVVRSTEDHLDPNFANDVSENLQPETVFVFPTHMRGTDPATGTPDSAGEVPSHWNFIGLTTGANESNIAEVDNIGVVNVTLEAGTIYWGYHTPRATVMRDGKWFGNVWKDAPEGAPDTETWSGHQPTGEHYMHAIHGSAGWHSDVSAGSGRLVSGVRISNGAPWNDMFYSDRKSPADSSLTNEDFAHYRFTGRISAHGSNIFVGNNVIAKPTKNFLHQQETDAGTQIVLFDYANHIGIDVNKSNYGGNQDNETVYKPGTGYYFENVVVRDNWVFNRGNKNFEVSGQWATLYNNHAEKFLIRRVFPYDYVTNPDVVAGASEAGGVDPGGVIFDGWEWKTQTGTDDFMNRGYDMAGRNVWVGRCTLVNSGSIGNDGEGVMSQEHNRVGNYSWAFTHVMHGKIDKGPGTMGENGWHGTWNMQQFGLLLLDAWSHGNIGVFGADRDSSPQSGLNWVLDVSVVGGNPGPGGVNSIGSDGPGPHTPVDYITTGHTDAVTPPSEVSLTELPGQGLQVDWTDEADNELGFRVERRIDNGSWETVAYRPMANESKNVTETDPLDISANPMAISDLNPQSWIDYTAPVNGDHLVEYRVVAINELDDDSTGVSDVVSFGSAPANPFTELVISFDDLATGQIGGQGDWANGDAADAAKTTVEAGALSYISPAGNTLDGGSQHLLLDGDTDQSLNSWLTHPLDPQLDETTYVRFLFSSSDLGTSENPGELFLRLNGWGLYVAAKYTDGIIESTGQTLEVDADNGLPINTTHMLVMRLNVEGDAVTSTDVWLNPDFSDDASPDLTTSGLNVALADITGMEIRSQKTEIRMDELKLAESWADVVPETTAVPFTQLDIPFDNLATGEIGGQGDWAIDAADAAKATVDSGSLTYEAADGAVLEGGSQHLFLAGDDVDSLNSWLTHPIDPQFDETTYVRFLFNSSELGTSDNPGELFLRLNGWGLYVAAKYTDGVIELNGETLEVDTDNGLPIDTTHMLVMRLNVEGDAVTSTDVWLNPDFSDDASPDLTTSGLNVALADITDMEIRSQKTEIRMDELKFAESWAAVVPEYIAPPFETIDQGFNDLTIGSIDGQSGWTIDAADAAKTLVAADSLSYTGPDGGSLDGGSQHLLLEGDPTESLNGWLSLPVDPPLDETTYVRFLFNSSELGTSENPGELFLRLKGWGLYVAAKYTAGVIELNGETLEVDAENGLPLDTTHMLVMRLNVEGGTVTSADAWLNPNEADVDAPALSATGLSVSLADITDLELRSQKTAVRVDELILTKEWSEAVPAAPTVPFTLQATSFEELTTGPLDGQDGWSAPAGVNVIGETLAMSDANGVAFTGGSQAVELNGSISNPIDDWTTAVIDETDPPDETFYISYFANVEDNGDTEGTDPTEFIMRHAGWSLFSALKVAEDAFEVNGEQLTGAGLQHGQTYHVVLRAIVDAGVITTVDGWLDPAFGLDEPAADAQGDVHVADVGLAVEEVTGAEMRSQKTRSVVDHLAITEKWSEAMALRRVEWTVTQNLSDNIQAVGIEDTAIGSDVSPHDPAEEPPTQDSIPVAEFQSMINAVYGDGLSGVVDFEMANANLLAGPELAGDATRYSNIYEMVIPMAHDDVVVTLGPNAYAEGNCNNGYQGKECDTTNFLDPSPPNTPDDYRLWNLESKDAGIAPSGTGTLGGMTSYDMEFDPADSLVAVGIAQVSYNIFQSYQRGFSEKPNIRARATFTNGSDEVVLISTQFSEQTAERNVWFAFEAPESGYYLSRLEVYQLGNNGRAWIQLDDLALVAEQRDVFTFTFNNQGQVDGSDRPIQTAQWNGVYSSTAQPLVTSDAIFADLSEGTSSDPTPGHYKAGFFFVSGKDGQPAPEGFLAWSENTSVTTEDQSTLPVNPQVEWYTPGDHAVDDLTDLTVKELRALSMRIKSRVKEAESRYHFALQVNGEWLVSEQGFLDTGSGEWVPVSLTLGGSAWYSGMLGDGTLAVDPQAAGLDVVSFGDLDPDATVDTVGFFIDTDDSVGNDSWSRIDSIMVEAVLEGVLPPAISTQPESVSAIPGATAEFSVAVAQPEGVTYQWQKDGADLDGATDAVFVIDAVAAEDAGEYTVIVTNEGGSTTSAAATLTVLPAPTVDPVSFDVAAGAGLQFINVTADAAANWTATSAVDWISVDDGASGTGDGMVTIFVQDNLSRSPRAGTLQIAGTEVTINQAGQSLLNWLGASDNGDGTYTSDWFGTFEPMAGTDWMLHEHHGWTVIADVEAAGGMFLWNRHLMAYTWTHPDIFPAVYSYDGGTWTAIVVEESGIIWMWDYDMETWAEM